MNSEGAGANDREETIAGTVTDPSTPVLVSRLSFLDNLRYLMILCMVVYHSVGAYASVAPHWVVHDTVSGVADIIRELFDVFMMPLLFFISGFFAPVSLEKKGVWGFIKDKVRRLLFPWALAVLIFLPLLLYDQPSNPVKPFLRFWPWYLSKFEVQLRMTQTPVGLTTQAIYWFISLLFVFFLLFVLVHAVTHRQRSGSNLSAEGKAAQVNSVPVSLLAFGLFTSVGYFIFLLLFPDSSWFTLHMFLEFQVTRLVPYAASFAFGIYAQSRGWFAGGKLLGSTALWAGISGVLAVAYLIIGQPVFADTAGTANHSVGLLLVFAFLRSFLILSLLIAFVSFGVRNWNHSNLLDRRLSSNSYDIYLTHYWFVIAFQGALLKWTGGPVLVKAAIVFVAALGLSFLVSNWVLARHSRIFAALLLALFVFCLAVRP